MDRLTRWTYGQVFKLLVRFNQINDEIVQDLKQIEEDMTHKLGWMGLLGLFLFIFVSNDCFKNAGAFFFLVNNFKFLNKMKTFIILVLKIKLII